MNNKKLAKATVWVTGILLISKGSGLCRDIALAYAYGTNYLADAFILSQSIISLFTGAIFGAVGIAFIPVISEYNMKKDHVGADVFCHTLYSVFGLMAICMGVVGTLFASDLVYLFAPGFSSATHDVAVTLTRVSMPLIFITFIMTIQGQQLKSKNIFLPSSMTGIIINILLIIGFVWFCPVFGIKAASIGNVMGVCFGIVFLGFFVFKIKYRFHFSLKIHNYGIRKIFILILPIMVGQAMQAINTMIDRMLASGLGTGSMAALNFSNKLALFVIGLISIGAGNVCYTKMSELGAIKDYGGLKLFLCDIINIINMIVVPATIGMIVLCRPIIKTVFEYGAFSDASTEMTTVTLVFYSIGMLGYCLRDMITRVFYAIHDTKTPMLNGIAAVIINIIGNLILVRFMGIAGLALATSISVIICTLFLLHSLYRKWGSMGLREMGVTFIKTCMAAILMGIAVHFIYIYLYDWIGIMPVALIISICMAFVIYGIMLLPLKIKEVDFVIHYLKKH